MNIIDILHSFFFFLGQPGGDLLKRSVELLLFLIVLYFIISEWLRDKKSELKFLIIAFSALVIQRMVVVYQLSYVVFGGLDLTTLIMYEELFEVFALFLVANAFVYPALAIRRKDARPFMIKRLIFIIGGSILGTAFFYSLNDLFKYRTQPFFETFIILAQLAIIFYYTYFILRHWYSRFKYKKSIIVAFLAFGIGAFIKLMNLYLYSGAHPSYKVASHPFPLIATLLFIRVIYLKLVDKAYIKRQLKASREQYLQEKQMGKLKDDFISVVSHELKTPLTSMKLYLALLRDGKLGKVSKKQKDAIGIVNEESNRLNMLISDLLDLSKLEAKKVKINKSMFDLNKVLSNKLYVNMAKERGIRVKNTIPRKFMVCADEEKFKQVFINLFNNSVKFTPKKGTITLCARKNDHWWEFMIKDTGRGIPRDQLGKLFDKFYQVEEVMTRNKGGTGLGLAIVKNIVELHKGTIKVESEVGKGTCFRIRFNH